MKEKTKEALLNLKKSFYALEECWQNEDISGNRELEIDYPFDISFDELNARVSDWVDDRIEDKVFRE